MRAKVMVLSYNSISGVPRGRYEKGNVVAYSAEWGFEKFADLSMLTVLSGLPFFSEKECNAQERAATTALENLQEMLVHDLPFVEIVYIYVGYSAMKSTMVFIKKLQELGKTVHMVACDCDRDAKVRFAEQLGIETVWTGCGGEHECGKIFAKHSA